MKLVLIDFALLLVTAASGFLHFAMLFCGMRGTQPWDMCSFYGRDPVFNTIILLHIIAFIAIVLDMLCIIFSSQEKLLNKKLRVAIPSFFIASSVLWMALINLV